MDWGRSRQIAFERDGGLCQRCSLPASDVHHRRPKGMGGTADPHVRYGPANLVSLCRECHSWVHGNPREAYRLGYLVRDRTHPEDVPLTIKAGKRYIFLTADGKAERRGEWELF